MYVKYSLELLKLGLDKGKVKQWLNDSGQSILDQKLA